MTKVRVHELAKELNKSNKEILDFLQEKKVEVKSHMSSLTDEQENMVKDAFGGKKEASSEETPKKKNIVQVFRPQNTQNGKRQGGQRSNNSGNNQRGNATGQKDRQNNNYRSGNGTNSRGNNNNQGSRNGDNRGERSGNRPFNRGERSGENRGENRNYNNRGDNRPDGRGERQGQKGGFSGQGRRDDRGQDNRRNNGRRDDRRQENGRGTSPSIPAPIVPEQKPQRQKGKENYKKKDYRDDDREERLPKGKKQKPMSQPVKPQPKPVEKEEEKIKMITIPETLTIQELADKMKIQPSVIVKKLFMQGKIVTVNQEVDFDTAEEIAMEFECLVEKEEVVDVIEELLKEDEEDESTMVKRPPVVCVMGHVDHGKTSLLDAIRNTNVIDREAGGITQHIGAYVATINGENITFLDTPGHEAFTAMRMRGASSTDIAILVVAADDGVMPQTVEAINHAKAAGIEIIVAVNKIDKPSANVERVKQELTEYGLIAEDWGGSTIFVPVSAHTHEGIDELLEMILLTAEVSELKANPNRRARGIVIEAQLDKGKGSVATVLVQKGTLHVGDPIAAGSAYGKVRAMMDDKGRRVKEAGPSMPVEILGLNDVPNAGEIFVGCESDKEARSFAETFISQNRVRMLEETKSRMSLDDLFSQIQAGNLKELGIIVKADVQGSVEAVKQSLLKLSNEEVVIKIIHGGVGAINESDVNLASASNAIIIGFNVRPDATAKEIAEREGVDLRLYRVIYDAIEDVQAAMKGMLDPVFEEKVLGHAEVRQTFKASGVGTIAGSYVLDGTFERGCSVRVSRDGVVIFEGALASLKRFKDDVKEVRAGYECGLVFEKFNDVKEEDQVEAFKMVEVPR
ncbi:translation initiation factor IF-2 [Faecalimonas umbilicata]|uniref:translation initiation factor IF-2 n=1 Tax=Faecalimonas umbilicata TaxID=1912855 RepID=UPI002943767E|nr:translation initiation factor IF-2 [Faecalimonas umbilicata]